MIEQLENLADGQAFDFVVIGAGAGGLAAALFARLAGKSVLLVERTDYLGGTTALSAATAWIPGSRHAAAVNPLDNVETAARFLDAVVGDHAPANLRAAFLASGPEAVEALETGTEVKFRPYPLHPDYEQAFPGATANGRALEPLPLDGRVLGPVLSLIRPPIPEFTLFGGMMVDRRDINHLLGLTKSWASLRHSLTILARYGLDRLKRRRGSRLVMGNALVGRFLLSLQKLGASILLRTSVKRLVLEGGAVTGVVLKGAGGERQFRATCGVILAAGGFGRNPDRRRELLPQPVSEFSPAAPGHTGEAQSMALALGARFASGQADNAFWAPVSVRRRPDGSTAVFPHFVLDRSKPGTLCVDGAGRRFVNESASYHVFARAMFEAHRAAPTIPSFLIADAVAMKKYGLGMVRMRTRDLTPFLADGYLVQGDSLDHLAGKLGVDATNLKASVAEINLAAVTGLDSRFGRGETLYHRVNGNAAHGPNPTLGPVATPPFYAVRLYPGDIGAANGLVIDEWARVKGEGGAPIVGLYACGAEAASIMGGVYPGPGITIGPAIVMAYRAIRAAAGDATERAA